MVIKRIPAGIYAANCYIIMDEHTKEAVVMDPGGDEDDIISAIEAMKAKVKYIVLTHGHADHTGGVLQLKKRYNAPIAISKRDEDLIINGAFMFGTFGRETKADINLSEGDKIYIGNIEILCLETPGHTPGGMCYVAENSVFTGDTLFTGSIGRTDLPGGDFDTIIKSIKEKLMILDENIIVYPGHGPQSTIRREKESNPFL